MAIKLRGFVVRFFCLSDAPLPESPAMRITYPISLGDQVSRIHQPHPDHRQHGLNGDWWTIHHGFRRAPYSKR